MTTKKLFPAPFLLALLLALLAPLAAQAQSTGHVAGRVSDDATRLALGGARVSVTGTALETYTADDGTYVLTNVPAGARTLTFNYVGYPEASRGTDVIAGQTTTLNVTFGSEVVQLDPFVIEGSLVGSARAINQQRAANSLTNIVAADEIGRFPDENAAESLQRLPGVSLYRDQGEGRYIDLRGLNYIYTSVTLNGAKVASPENGARAIALDVVPADSLSALEVVKVSTPDMDGEGLGGVVNIKTKSPFDSDGRTASFSAQSIYSALTSQYGSKFNAAASALSQDGRFGALAAVTWQERKFGSHNYEIDDGWDLRTAPGGGQAYFLQDIAFRDYEITRQRYGASTALEFKPDTLTRLAFKATYNRFTDDENRYVSYIPFTRGTVTALDADSASITGVSRTRRDLRNRSKNQDLSAFSLEGEKQTGNWTLDGRIATSRGHETKPSEIVARFRHNASNTNYDYAFSDTFTIAVTQTGGPGTPDDPAFYDRLDRVSEESSTGTETEDNLALNTRHDFTGAGNVFIKFGGSYRTKDKETDSNYSEYSAGPAAFTFASLAIPQGDYPYFRAPRIDSAAFRAFLNANRSAFTGGLVPEDSLLDDFVTGEDVLAGYLMGGTTFGSTSVTAGARLEHTDFETTGNELTDGAGLRSVTTSRSYDHVLPSLIIRHDATKSLVFRTSYSMTLMRPEFSEASTRRNINTDDDEVEAGNPQLDALESHNLDASVEYYLPSLGMVSAAVFQKRIDHFSYALTIPGGDPLYPTFDLITFRNGSDGKVNGLELAYQQQLRMLPAPFDGLGFMANATFSDSSATYPTRPGEKLPFIGQSDRTGNVALTYEKYGFFARLAMNFRGAHLREDEPIGGDATQDRWIDDYSRLDLSLSYRFAKNWEVFTEMTNLTNEPFRVYQQGGGTPAKRLVQVEEYDWTANFGVRWKL